MSIFKKIKRKVQHTAEQAVETVKDAGETAVDEVSDGAKETAHAVQSAAEAALQELDQVSAIVDKAFKEVEKKVDHLTDEAKAEVLKVSAEAKKEINHTLDEAKSEIVEYAAKVLDEIQKGFGTLEEAFTPLAIQKAIQICLAAAKAHPVYPNEIDLELPGGLTFAWEDIPEKIGVLEEYAHHPPKGRDQIMEFIEALSPTKLTVQETIQIELVIISSSALEFGPSVVYTAEQVDAVLKSILDRIGVH